jgi:GNAT superfamily N-acetyltransferase
MQAAASVMFKPARTAGEIAVIADLAREIWYDYYIALIGRAQVDYMVAKFQSIPAMLEQIAQGYSYFTIEQDAARPQNERIELSRRPLGYFAVSPQQDRLFISKLYLLQTERGRGTGRRALEFIERTATGLALDYLSLTVNKENPSVVTYQRWGFKVVEAIVTDIGGGFVMDDFRMEKPVDSSR